MPGVNSKQTNVVTVRHSNQGLDLWKDEGLDHSYQAAKLDSVEFLEESKSLKLVVQEGDDEYEF